ncbi:hypothetical protein Tsubulata_000538 [Turnera subulata]|uniref:Uncharacterized protein n=1 Tax=Turnera subulata TaxID=218843 RepID=A0A9Q0J9F8_9ROSI|nr:hypothetical protein Tsubulata_000538 [Turnera subulata]
MSRIPTASVYSLSRNLLASVYLLGNSHIRCKFLHHKPSIMSTPQPKHHVHTCASSSIRLGQCTCLPW